MRLEYHAWPIRRRDGGQQSGPDGYGVLLVDLDTGISVVVTSERSQLANRRLAEARIHYMATQLTNTGWEG